jgi:hypothetical protein
MRAFGSPELWQVGEALLQGTEQSVQHRPKSDDNEMRGHLLGD